MGIVDKLTNRFKFFAKRVYHWRDIDKLNEYTQIVTPLWEKVLSLLNKIENKTIEYDKGSNEVTIYVFQIIIYKLKILEKKQYIFIHMEHIDLELRNILLAPIFSAEIQFMIRKYIEDVYLNFYDATMFVQDNYEMVDYDDY